MKNSSSDLTQGNIAKNMLLFGLPLMASNVLQILFNMADIAVAGRFSGANALGSIGSTAIMVMLYTDMLIGIGSGINVAVAQTIGEGKKHNVSVCVRSCFTVALVMGIAVMLASFFSAAPLLNILGTKSELIEGAELYMKIYSLGFPALALYNYGNGVFSAAGNTKTPLLILSCSGVINVILNLFFVITLKMSVDGVAIASVTSQYISAAAILFALTRCGGVHKLHFKRVKPTACYIKKVLALGVPAALQNSIFAIANFFIQAGVNTFDTVMVEGNSAAANADPLVYDVMAAFYTAGASFIGQNYGAKKKSRIRKSFILSTVYSFSSAAILGILLFIFGRHFLYLFTTESTVVEAGMQRLQIMSFSYCVSAFMDNTIAASRGIGKSFMPTVIVIMGSCVFRVAWVYTVFAHFKTVPSLYLLYIFSWTITAAAEIAYFFAAYKKQTKGVE